MAEIPVVRATVEWVAAAPFHAPPDLGVTLRGAFGNALFDVGCARPHRECGPCDLRASCPIPGWFDPGRVGSNAPRPFALRVASAPRRILATWTWVGPIPRVSLVIESFVRAGMAGFGADRVPHTVRRLTVEGDGSPVVVVADGEVLGRWPDAVSLGRLVRVPFRPIGAEVTLASRTVLRTADFAGLIDAAISRARGLARYLGGRIHKRWPDVPPGAATDELQHEGAGRWSQRQGARIDLSGHTGVIRVGPAVADYVDLLAAAAVVGVGSGTSSGNGAVDVRWVEGR